MLNKIAIIGVGLIGGSIAKALKSANYSKQIIGYTRNLQTLTAAHELGILDNYTDDITTICDADIIILASPISSFKKILIAIKPHLNANTIITDVSSVKGYVCKMASDILTNSGAKFIPAHPLAGKEINGYLASDSKLFNNKKLIITPMVTNSKQDITIIANMWQKIGAIIEYLSITKHDEILASTSHLPHVLAFSLMNYLPFKDKNFYNYVAGGFKDFSRIASSDSNMWADVCIANKQEITTSINEFNDKLQYIASLIANEDKQELINIFTKSKQDRDNWLKTL